MTDSESVRALFSILHAGERLKSAAEVLEGKTDNSIPAVFIINQLNELLKTPEKNRELLEGLIQNLADVYGAHLAMSSDSRVILINIKGQDISICAEGNWDARPPRFYIHPRKEVEHILDQ